MRGILDGMMGASGQGDVWWVGKSSHGGYLMGSYLVGVGGYLVIATITNVAPFLPSYSFLSLFLLLAPHSRVMYELILKGWLFKKGHMKISVFKLFQVSEVGCVCCSEQL